MCPFFNLVLCVFPYGKLHRCVDNIRLTPFQIGHDDLGISLQGDLITEFDLDLELTDVTCW